MRRCRRRRRRRHRRRRRRRRPPPPPPPKANQAIKEQTKPQNKIELCGERSADLAAENDDLSREK